jgi:RND family efflux transporter MFP subunit
VPGEAGKALPKGTPTVTVKVEQVSPRIDIAGTVESEERINLSSRISAYVQQVFASAGNAVSKGQELIILDDREMKQELAMAEAELNQAETELRRTQELIRSNAATDQQLTTVRANYDRAKSAVERIKVMLTYTRIISPIDGVVTERRVEVGDLANPGEVLLGVYDARNLRIVVPVPVRLVEKLPLGTKTQVELEPHGAVSGVVSEIVGEIDPESRTQDVKVRLEEMPQVVIPGTFGRVWVLEDAHPGILVPQEAVYKIGQLEMVQVVRDDERVVSRMVRTGPVYGDRVEILSGLQDGETIVTAPIH